MLAVGTGRVLEDGSVRTPDVRTGDQVLFGKYSGTDVELDGVKVVILREEEILGVLGDELG